MATIESVVQRVRVELGDLPTSFDIVVNGNGVATRFETGTYPIDGTALEVFVDNVPEPNAEVDERTGVVTFDMPPVAGSEVRFTGTKYRYFGSADMAQFVKEAVAEQTHHRTDSYGRQITLLNLPMVEEYPLAILGTVKALWALLTDASFDLDIYAPDGVSIPRSQRHRQLTELLSYRQQQYKEYADALQIGINRIEVFNLRRVSKQTGRLVPVWREKEVEDNSKPIRVYLPSNTLGGEPISSPRIDMDLSLVRGDTFAQDITFDHDVSGYTFLAQIKQFSDSHTVITPFEVSLVPGEPNKATLRLTPKLTSNLPLQSVWDIQLTKIGDPDDVHTPFGGRVFADRDVSR